MSELKSFIVLYNGKFIRAYEETEADKVIAGLNDKLQKESALLKETREWLIESQKMHKRCADNAIKIIRHQKYKWCLDKARWCETRHFAIRYLQADKILNDENYIGTFYYIRREYMIKHYCRWANKWLELAEKFKEAKQ